MIYIMYNKIAIQRNINAPYIMIRINTYKYT